MNEKEGSEFVVDVPLEAKIFADGRTSVDSLIYTTSPEALEKYNKECEEKGGSLVSQKELKSEEEFRQVLERASKSYGFARWNSSWNPEGPKKNWVVAPKNPSNN
ncbi:MAG: hypothetical protein A3B47_03105 [Candidatus Levybacteria bacterium RIFCSPLOWO2_01_FULL_39_24]|nr:MAG: hypothetical protein A2800_02395 [Candidatus Levybacteria bacterium RIFCSPHIGHO2_01_FULL_40_16]OGH28097.1 MAG: hypothetical protein A3E12_03565 [Candidatus Levybacteria bacterium RIFCSPHIGHO2_12_FULL_39_9]OGH46608.1 MAG: hypothetical protein A3B47_03105 [Candidatus Levybacteria bacterium RIFCSPLOWO2_01_FULL_39_24]